MLTYFFQMFKGHVPIICQGCLIFQFHSTVFPTQEITRYALPLSCKCEGWKLKQKLITVPCGLWETVSCNFAEFLVMLFGNAFDGSEIPFLIFGPGINISLFRWLVNSNYMRPTSKTRSGLYMFISGHTPIDTNLKTFETKQCLGKTTQSHRIHVWYIYLHLVDFHDVGKYTYTIHWWYGNGPKNRFPPNFRNMNPIASSWFICRHLCVFLGDVSSLGGGNSNIFWMFIAKIGGKWSH